jgi:hypothetical protein
MSYIFREEQTVDFKKVPVTFTIEMSQGKARVAIRSEGEIR